MYPSYVSLAYRAYLTKLKSKSSPRRQQFQIMIAHEQITTTASIGLIINSDTVTTHFVKKLACILAVI